MPIPLYQLNEKVIFSHGYGDKMGYSVGEIVACYRPPSSQIWKYTLKVFSFNDMGGKDLYFTISESEIYPIKPSSLCKK